MVRSELCDPEEGTDIVLKSKCGHTYLLFITMSILLWMRKMRTNVGSKRYLLYITSLIYQHSFTLIFYDRILGPEAVLRRSLE